MTDIDDGQLTPEQKDRIAKLLKHICDYCEDNDVSFGEAHLACLSLAAVTGARIGQTPEEFGRRAEAMFQCDQNLDKLN